jgi:DnaJ-class molecular chaperone
MTDSEERIKVFKCPVCSGFGTVSFKKVKCHACQGKGFVVINLDRQTDANKDTPHRDMAR